MRGFTISITFAAQKNQMGNLVELEDQLYAEPVHVSLIARVFAEAGEKLGAHREMVEVMKATPFVASKRWTVGEGENQLGIFTKSVGFWVTAIVNGPQGKVETERLEITLQPGISSDSANIEPYATDLVKNICSKLQQGHDGIEARQQHWSTVIGTLANPVK